MVTHNNPPYPFTIMVLLDAPFAAMCPKPRHLKHFVFEVLVGDLGVEVEGLETLWLEVVSFENWKEKFLKKFCFYPFVKICRSHHY